MDWFLNDIGHRHERVKMGKCENHRNMISGIKIFDKVVVDDLNIGKGVE